MIIANPIYDVVFKYLMEDLDIAQELLSTILEEEIIGLTFKPQETATELMGGYINILRFDFKATIRTASGEHKKVLIELQKAKLPFDAIRFRRYLGDNYKKEDTITLTTGEEKKATLPIVTIYFLGFPLDNTDRPVIKVNRQYIDVATQEVLEGKQHFIELLTHDAWFIQIPLLVGKTRTKLERVLQVFSPEYKTNDNRYLDYVGSDDDGLTKKMVHRLERASASEEMRHIMEVEDEVLSAFQETLQSLMDTSIELAVERQKLTIERQKAETERQKAETERQKAEEANEKAEAERQKAEDLQRQLDDLRKQLGK